MLNRRTNLGAPEDLSKVPRGKVEPHHVLWPNIPAVGPIAGSNRGTFAQIIERGDAKWNPVTLPAALTLTVSAMLGSGATAAGTRRPRMATAHASVVADADSSKCFGR